MDEQPNPVNEQPNGSDAAPDGQPVQATSGVNDAAPATPAVMPSEQAPASPTGDLKPNVVSTMDHPPAPGMVNPQIVQSVQPTVAPQPVVAGGAEPVVAAAMPVMGQAPAAAGENPEKNYLLALAFSYLLGTLGVDRFYLGYTVTGILKLITFGGFGIWHFIDLLRIALGRLKEKNNPMPLEGFGKFHKTMKPIAIVLLVIEGLVLVGVVAAIVINVVLAVNLKNSTNNTNNWQSTSGQTLNSNIQSN